MFVYKNTPQQSTSQIGTKSSYQLHQTSVYKAFFLFLYMIQRIEIALSPKNAQSETFIKQQVLKKLHLSNNQQLVDVIAVRRSIDARSKVPVVRLLVDAYIDEAYIAPPSIIKQYSNVKQLKSNCCWCWTCWLFCCASVNRTRFKTHCFGSWKGC